MKVLLKRTSVILIGFMLAMMSAFAVTIDLNAPFNPSAYTGDEIYWPFDANTQDQANDDYYPNHNLNGGSSTTGYFGNTYENTVYNEWFDDASFWPFCDGGCAWGYWLKGSGGSVVHSIAIDTDSTNLNFGTSSTRMIAFFSEFAFIGADITCQTNLGYLLNDDQWHHYSVAWEGGSTMNFYRDGVLFQAMGTGDCTLNNVASFSDYFSNTFHQGGGYGRAEITDNVNLIDDFFWINENLGTITWVAPITSDPPTWDESLDNVTFDFGGSVSATLNWTTNGADAFASTDLAGASIVTNNGSQTASLSWTPSSPGTYNFEYRIENEDGSDNRTAVYTVNAIPPTYDEEAQSATLDIADSPFSFTLNASTTTNDYDASVNESDFSVVAQNGTKTVDVTFSPSRLGVYEPLFTISNGDGSDTTAPTYTVTGTVPVFDEELQDADVTLFGTYTHTLNWTSSLGTVLTCDSPYVTVTNDNVTQTASFVYNPQEAIYEGISCTVSNFLGSDTFSVTYRVLKTSSAGTGSASSTVSEGFDCILSYPDVVEFADGTAVFEVQDNDGRISYSPSARVDGDGFSIENNEADGDSRVITVGYSGTPGATGTVVLEDSNCKDVTINVRVPALGEAPMGDITGQATGIGDSARGFFNAIPAFVANLINRIVDSVRGVFA